MMTFPLFVRGTVGACALVLVLQTPAFAQLGLIGNVIRGASSGGNQPAAAAAGAQADEPDPNDGTLEDYLEMRAFAEGLYHQLEGPADALRISSFKRRADKAFEESNNDDMQRAFEMNVSAKSEVRRVIEDRFRVYDGLYDNPVVQALANRVGQSVVPAQVQRLYTFKLVADPKPSAEALSTGTIWVSTGMVALMKNKAQLAYVLAHEAAHVYLNHHRQRVWMQLAQEEYNRQLKVNGESRVKSMIWKSVIGAAIGGAIIGGVTGNGIGGIAGGALTGSLLGVAGGAVLGSIGNPRALRPSDWNRFEEDEADRLAIDWLLASNIDVREVPAVFVALRDIGEQDPRIKLGFLGRTDRVRERLVTVQARLKSEESRTGLVNVRRELSDSDFDQLLAEVQRDNGVFAFHYDMLETARANLRGAVAVKTKDPTALYFYARVLSQTARTAAERAEADSYFLQASQNDVRNYNYGSYLHRAIVKLGDTNASESDKQQAAAFLKSYVLGYHLSMLDEEQAKDYRLPPHLEMVYDYMARAGDGRWVLDEATIAKAKQNAAKGQSLYDLTVGPPPAPPKPPKPTPVINKPKPQ